MKNPKTIQVFGSGCPTCKTLHERTVKAAVELGIATPVEYVTEIQRIIDLGLMQSPVLAIDDEPVIVGFVPSIEDIKNSIKDKLAK